MSWGDGMCTTSSEARALRLRAHLSLSPPLSQGSVLAVFPALPAAGWQVVRLLEDAGAQMDWGNGVCITLTKAIGAGLGEGCSMHASGRISFFITF